MAAYIKTLQDSTGANDIYPKTQALAVYLENGTTVEDYLATLRNIFISTSTPVSPKLGDIWLKTDS